MISGEIKSQIDGIWTACWSGGISNPLEVIEQITYLLFLRRLDDLHTLEENKASRLKRPMERRIFPEGKDIKGRSYDDLRWSRFKHFSALEMFAVVNDHVFPFLRTLGGDDSTYAHHMKDARFTIPTPALLPFSGGFAGWCTDGRPGHQRRPLRIYVVSQEVAGLPSQLAAEAEETKRFDILMLKLQLAILQSEPAFERWREQVKSIAGLLEEKLAIPLVGADIA